MTRIQLKYKSDRRFFKTENETTERLIFNCTDIAAVRLSYFGKVVIEEREIPTLNHHSYYSLLKHLDWRESYSCWKISSIYS